MCFAPYISLSTFVIEFLLAGFFLFKNPRDNLNRIIAVISLGLGIYQLNEFLICVTGFSLFTRLAMIVTAILPALAVTYALIMSRKKVKYYWYGLIYAPVVFFVLMFSMTSYLKVSAVCSTVFVQFPWMRLLSMFFGLYYILYILMAMIVFYFAAANARSKYERRLVHLGMLGMVVLTVPAFVFLLFLPAMRIQIASVLCEFALLLVIEFVIVLWYKDKHGLKY